MTVPAPHPFAALDATLLAIGKDRDLLLALSRRRIRSFTTGGCLIFAEAVAAWAGKHPVTTWVVVEDGTPEHVAVEFGPLWLDAGGARDRSDFEFDIEQHDFENYEIRTLAELAVGHHYPLHPTGLHRDPALSAKIAKRLRTTISAAEVWAAAEAQRIR